jgi:hypothetical protein
MDMEMDTDMDMDMDMELTNNYPYSVIWNASEIARRYFQWRYIPVAPLQYGKKIIPLLELFATLGEGLGCVLIKSTLGFRGNPEGRNARGNGEQWGTKGTVYEQPGSKEDHSCHSWRAPSK